MKTYQLMAAAASAVSLAGLTAPVSAYSTDAHVSGNSLNFDSAPVADVVSQFHSTFGGYIVIKPGVNDNLPVSFSVSSIRQDGAGIETVQDLANALNADWQKSFVISRATSDDTTPTPIIDTKAPLDLSSTTMSAEDAIQLVANADGATVKFYSPVEGTVHFSSRNLTAPQAAREIAEQTHTVWKAYYAIAPRTSRQIPLGAKVIGRTAGGRPILEMPTVTFRTPPPDVTPPAADQTAANPATADQTQANAANQNMSNTANPYAANPYLLNPYGMYPYGYNPYGGYGYSGYPYGFNPYGYTPGYSGNGLTVLPQSPFYYNTPPIVFGGTP